MSFSDGSPLPKVFGGKRRPPRRPTRHIPRSVPAALLALSNKPPALPRTLDLPPDTYEPVHAPILALPAYPVGVPVLALAVPVSECDALCLPFTPAAIGGHGTPHAPESPPYWEDRSRPLTPSRFAKTTATTRRRWAVLPS
ncbi:hypothetical protein TRAPUB_8589 [Trametes pubescens]|uniref:Uncharacterized protein n=1 Tax=Trametes pubescens TaxID=154538 RepID=A0A1M2W4V4_TRAPU|nr:hypothetical protein TRAPUB_8589 [Trametes pubescens]